MKSLPVLLLLFLFSITIHGKAKKPERGTQRFAAIHATANTAFTVLIDTNKQRCGTNRKHRLIAALLAFPLTGGIFGLHRVYLGTSPLIPLAYIASYGGIGGVVPFVDFMLIVVCKDVNVYAHNNSLFMWSRKKLKTEN